MVLIFFFNRSYLTIFGSLVLLITVKLFFMVTSISFIGLHPILNTFIVISSISLLMFLTSQWKTHRLKQKVDTCVTKLKNGLFALEKSLETSAKCIRFIQEMELVSRGFTLWVKCWYCQNLGYKGTTGIQKLGKGQSCKPPNPKSRIAQAVTYKL